VTAPLATIIIVTHNSARWLARAVAAVVAQSETRWRLVVIDNNSSAEQRPTHAALPAGAVLIQSETNLGFAAANNEAAAAAETPFLVFLNPDAFPEPDWFAKLIAAAERHPRAAAIGSTQVRADAPGVYDGTGDVLHASGLAYRSSFGKTRDGPPPEGESFAACAAAMLVRREAFNAVGGFDPRYFCFFEDVDLCFRLRLARWRIVQTPDAVVAHVGGASAPSDFAQYHGARNRLWTFIKCMPGALFWPLLPAHLALSALAASIALLSGRGTSAWRGLFAGFAGWGAAWRARQMVQSARTAGVAEIARMLAWSPVVLLNRAPVIRPL
jgi:N-acetylglucosaminyl-diphospho-decaprenol L-rhamnosyltransferase